MATMRHWRQRFYEDGEFVFRKRLLFLGKQVSPGDPVTPEMKKFLGSHKLKIWWEGRFIELAPEGTVAATPPGLTQVKRGWWEVTLADGSKRKVQGKAKAEALLAEQTA